MAEYAHDSLGNRMKEYESVSKNKLIRRMPAIIRLDGRAFHTFTKNMKRPFDEIFFKVMLDTTFRLVHEIQNVEFAYVQSDEISILMKDYSKLESQSWFGGEIQKITSISAALCSVIFNQEFYQWPSNPFLEGVTPVFDSRVFNIPKEDVVNYFIWRQKDATRNSINATAQAVFSHSELQGQHQDDVLEMLHNKEIEWAKFPTVQKRGLAVVSQTSPEGRRTFHLDYDMPILTENREYILQYL